MMKRLKIHLEKKSLKPVIMEEEFSEFSQIVKLHPFKPAI